MVYYFSIYEAVTWNGDVRIMNFTKLLRKIGLVIIDAIFVIVSIFLGLFIRFDTNIPADYIRMGLIHGAFIVLIFVAVFYFFELYKSIWEYASVKEVLMICTACMCAILISTVVEFALPDRLPLTIMIILFQSMVFFASGIRLSYRLARRLVHNNQEQCPKRRAMIIGAGDAGSSVIREMRMNPQIGGLPVVIIDDDKLKQGQKMMGIPVVGGTDVIAENAEKYKVDDIIFAIPSASHEDKQRILQACAQTGRALLMMSSQEEAFQHIRLNKLIRPVRIEDLLGREEIKLDIPAIAGYLTGKTVLITGGGGSIGSEIARQVMRFQIKKLVLLDIYENCVYDLYNELKQIYGEEMPVEVVIASIRDKERLNIVFRTHAPDIIFHAAAHKHVPLMEANPGEAIKNNVFGTLNVVNMADEFGAERFILISTDKAVNPTNVMGATKRIAELLIQSMDKRSETKFMAVRFGNVLGSNGSVVPLFQKQIENGGPVTITHTDIERFFMTIPEAAQLVIQAGALADGGEIFVLDMGKPVKIMDLAVNMIRLSGMEPSKDIQIEVVGLRPGEKLYEELLYTDVSRTRYDRILVEKPCDISYERLQEEVIQMVMDMEDSKAIREAVARIVPGYRYQMDNDSESAL